MEHITIPSQLTGMNGTVRIEIRNLSFSYSRENSPDVREENEGPWQLRGIRCSIGPGERIALLGANGSGKSTLLRCLTGLLSPPPGTVHIHGLSPEPLDPARETDRPPIHRGVGMISQDPDEQIVGAVVEEDIAYGPRNLGLAEAEVRRRVQSALDLVGLEKLKARPPQFLSGGERQRLAIAAVLAMDPAVLILDEATSMLDGLHQERIDGILAALVQQGRTVIQVTHRLEEALRCTRCLVLSAGQLVFDGDPWDLVGHPSLYDWGFRPGHALSMVRSLQRLFPGFSTSSLAPSDVAHALVPYLDDVEAWSTARERWSRFRSTPGKESLSFSKKGPLSENIPSPCVEVQHLGHHYGEGTPFATAGLVDCSVSVYPGESLALIGPSGAGKTTFLKHLNAILLPTTGTLRVLNQNPLDPGVSLRRLRQKVILAVQHPERALFEPYVADDIAYGPQNLGFQGKALLERVAHAMKQVGLNFNLYKDRRCRELSGGEKRRVALAGVLAMDGAVYLLDEPTAALDGRGTEEVLSLLRTLQEKGKTLIVSTHSLEEALQFDKVAVVVAGRLVQIGAPRQLFYRLWDPSWQLERPWIVRFAEELSSFFSRTGEKGPNPGEPLIHDSPWHAQVPHIFEPCSIEECLDMLLGDYSSEKEREIPAVSPAISPVEGMRPPQGDDAPALMTYPLAEKDLSYHAGAKAGDAGNTGQERNTSPEGSSAPRKKRSRTTTGIEFFRTITMGLFVDRPSRLRSLSPSLRLILTVLSFIFILASSRPLYPLICIAIFLVAGALLGNIRPSYLLKNIRPMIPYLLFMVLLQLLFSWPEDTSAVLWRWWLLDVTTFELERSLLMVGRFVAFVVLLSLFTALTSPDEMLRSLSKLLRPLGYLGIPVPLILVVLQITFNFIPILVEEAERIVVAQYSRGGGYEGRWKLAGRIRAALALTVPLFIRALDRAEALSRAMELRLFENILRGRNKKNGPSPSKEIY
ncbi:MAG TPA: ATP-binding cassette domain-containing protein [Termitinemataceae bacterium]|nr:ATP-binding cassette domain-containing protein [Termitinemataceae bacterium]HOM23442.1 ATP-binding cassette domain-containing protein [Termitinemataceae bacterium]HPQ00551.1 ATP-binding cassette domain-containing protein [Termitinemataceae bacterium]